MGKLKKTLKKIEDAMAAASFAEEGEFETAKQMVKEERRVLLALRRGQMDRKTFRYAMNTCKRIGASLDVLYISPSEAADPELEGRLAELRDSGIDYRLIRKGGCLKQEIIAYTNSMKKILFAVTESSDNLDVDCTGGGKQLSEAWKKLKCPLVVVTEGA